MPKFENLCRTVLQLRRDEAAVVCLLLLRGPQTPGELRSRADRLYSFDELAAVTATLERLARRPAPEEAEATQGSQRSTGPLVVLLPRQPGSREARYAHLLGGPVAAIGGLPPMRMPVGSPPPKAAALRWPRPSRRSKPPSPH